MNKLAPFFFASAFAMSSATAQVAVSDSGTTTPTIGANDAGFIGDVIDTETNDGTTTIFDNWTTGPAGDGARFGFNDGENFGQSFEFGSVAQVQSIFVAYNQFRNGQTITVDLDFNGVSVATGLLLDGNNFSSANPGLSWMEFDISSQNIQTVIGTNDFLLTATADSGPESFAFAPIYSRDGDYYADGAMTASFTSGGLPNGSDLGFVVTTVPEPSTSILLLGSVFGLAMLRRR